MMIMKDGDEHHRSFHVVSYTCVGRMAYPQWVNPLIRPPDTGGHLLKLAAYLKAGPQYKQLLCRTL
jgi:hypothetical protein